MPDRILKESIRTSESINKLTAFEETVFYRLIVSVNKYGYIDARARIINRTLFPLKDIRDCQIEDALQKLFSAGLARKVRNNKDGKLYVGLTNWDRYQDTHSATAETAKEEKKPRQTKPRPVLTAEQQKRFDRFWIVYPKKKNKDDARRRWKAIDPDDELTEAIIQGVARAKRGRDWQKDGGQYIPNPATWLNNAGWEDEVEPAKEGTALLYNTRLEDWN